MNARSKVTAKILAAAIGLFVAGGAVADASAATIVKKTVVTHRIAHPVVLKKVRIVHRPHVAAVRVLPGHRIAPRLKVARAFSTRHVVKTTVVR